MICFLDMDGVIADFRSSIADMCGFPREQLASYDGYDIHTLLGFTRERLTEIVELAGIEFWTSIQPYPWLDNVLQTIDMVIGLANTYILTDPGDHWTHSSSGKTLWIKKYLPKILHNRIILTPHKYLLAAPNRVLIDDRDKKCEEFIRAGGEAIVFPQPWNNNKGRRFEDIII